MTASSWASQEHVQEPPIPLNLWFLVPSTLFATIKFLNVDLLHVYVIARGKSLSWTVLEISNIKRIGSKEFKMANKYKFSFTGKWNLSLIPSCILLYLSCFRTMERKLSEEVHLSVIFSLYATSSEPMCTQMYKYGKWMTSQNLRTTTTPTLEGLKNKPNQNSQNRKGGSYTFISLPWQCRRSYAVRFGT